MFENAVERQGYRDMLEVAASEWVGRHYLLKADGKPLAFGLCFHKQRTLVCHVTAFDPDPGHDAGEGGARLTPRSETVGPREGQTRGSYRMRSRTSGASSRPNASM